MSAKKNVEFRYYVIPKDEIVLPLMGSTWNKEYGEGKERLHFHNYYEVGICHEGNAEMILGEQEFPCYEVLIGTVLSGIYNDGKVDSITIAQIGQEAENNYFGKPSGLMDQMACSVGGLIYIDFENPENPIVEKIDVDFDSFNHSLCIVDTKGSHADLTDDYAEIPAEMGRVASFFGVDVLRQINEKDFYKELSLIRKYAGDRAVLRTIHWFDENGRVENECKALREGDFARFKELIWDSGQSSYKYLQNVYSVHKPEDQSLAVALMMTRKILGNDGVWRVHGGGFAGTIQAFVPNSIVENYKEKIEHLFGRGSCYVLKVRPDGGRKVV